MTQGHPVARRLAIGLVAVVVTGGAWLALGPGRDTPDAMDEPPVTSGSGAHEPLREVASTPREPVAPRPDYHIEKGGRLSIDAASLPADGVVALELAIDEEALGGGQDPLSTVLVSASDGRRLESSAVPVAGRRDGVRLEVESAWLEAGLYMIQVRTAEKNPLPVRRYVLEVSSSQPR